MSCISQPCQVIPPTPDLLLELGIDAQLAAGGMQAIVVENFGSWPFPKGTPEQPTPPWQVAALTRAALAVQAESGLPTGINVLRNDARAALAIAALE